MRLGLGAACTRVQHHCTDPKAEDAVAVLAHEIRTLLKNHRPHVGLQTSQEVDLNQVEILTDTSSSDVEVLPFPAPTSSNACPPLANASNVATCAVALPQVRCNRMKHCSSSESAACNSVSVEATLANEIRRSLAPSVETLFLSAQGTTRRSREHMGKKSSEPDSILPDQACNSPCSFSASPHCHRRWRAGVLQSAGIFDRQECQPQPCFFRGQPTPNGACAAGGPAISGFAPQNEAGTVIMDVSEKCQVPMLPLQSRRHRHSRSTPLHWSYTTPSPRKIRHSALSPSKLSQSGRNGEPDSFKRLRRISARRLQPELSPPRNSFAVVQCTRNEAQHQGGPADLATINSMPHSFQHSILQSLPVKNALGSVPAQCLKDSQATYASSAASHMQTVCGSTQWFLQQESASQEFSNLASVVGDSQLPGWSARLILCLGGGARTAKPLACTNRHIAWSLLRDSVQLSAELRPIAQALTCASVWGDQEEGNFSCVQDSSTVLSALARLDIGPCNPALHSDVALRCTGTASSCVDTLMLHADADASGLLPATDCTVTTKPRRQTRDRAMKALRDCKVNIEQVRVQRVGCLLSRLAERARSLSQRLAAPRFQRSRTQRASL